MIDKNTIPEHWKIVKVKEIAQSIQYGYTESSSKDVVGPKFLRITDIQDNKVSWANVPYCRIEKDLQKKYLLQDGDLVFARTGATVGKSFLIKGNIPEAVFASYLIRLRFPKEVSDKFIYNFFQSQFYWKQIEEGQVGIGQPNVNGTKLGHLFILLPPLSEQQEIVAKIEELFSELDKGKEQLEAARQQLKVYRQAVLKWAFEGKFTNSEVKDGELPDGWIIKKLNEIGSWKGGGTPSKSTKEFWESGNILWVSPKDMKSKIIHDTLDKITLKAVENSSTKIISKGSILFVVRSGILRRTLPVAITINEVTVNQDIQAFTPENVSPDYVYWYMQAANDDIRKSCSKAGTTVESIESSLLKNYSIPICSLEEQTQIAQEIENRLSVCDKVEETITQSLQQAETLRQSILKKAFEGKLVKPTIPAPAVSYAEPFTIGQ